MTPRTDARPTFGLRLAAVTAVAAATLAVPLPAYADEAARGRDGGHGAVHAVVHWNTLAEQAFAPSQGTNPMTQSRTLAILQASIHDALNAIERRYEPYTPGLAPAPQASPDVAVAAAAREVLVALLPDQAARIEGAYGRALADVSEGPAKTAGIATGQAAARATMSRRRSDGAAQGTEPTYIPRPGKPGEYQFTAPFEFSAQPGWGRVQPFAIDLSAHALKGPHVLTSVEYARDFAEVRRIGRVDSSTRTADQTEIATFWYEDSPLGWNRIANTVVRQRRLDAWEAARTFALLHFAMADGFIAGFAEKYEHRFWRPITAIHAAAGDGNPATDADPSWQPLLVTPPVPDYPSTHTVLGWAAAEVLIELFGDGERYVTTSLTLPNVTRRYRGFSQAAEENGLSRLYGGIHFPHAVTEGRYQGRSIGRAVARMLPATH